MNRSIRFASLSSTRFASLGRIVPALLLFCAGNCTSQVPEGTWKEMSVIVARIKAPQFPDKEFSVAEFGAKNDGMSDCTEAFRKAIEACSQKGGGRVLVPKGEYLTGPIRLRSNVDLHVSEGAIVKFQRDPKRYLPVVLTRWEGVECMNYSPFIYAFDQDNIAITGTGTLDGQSDEEHWWFWKGNKDAGWKEGAPSQTEARKKLFDMGEKNVPVAERIFGEGFFLRPSFIQPYKCRNILIEGVKIIGSPMWEIHPVLSENITVRNVRIDSHGPNNDGCNPESCRDVLIEGCSFDTGDDCIAIKSGRNNDGRRLHTPSENIVVRKCMFKDGHGGITIGSEMSGGVRNVYVEDCQLESPILYSAIRIKSNAVRGGTVENVFVRNIGVGLVARAVVDIDLFYEEGKNGPFLPVIRNIEIESMSVKKCKSALNLVGYENAKLKNIRLSNCTFTEATDGYKIENVEGLEIAKTTINGKELIYP